MTSQVDLDQGGTFRQWAKVYMGPSVGWINAPVQNVFPITSAGTYFLDPSTSFVTVNTSGSVTIVLPSCVDPTAGAQAQPGLFANNPIVIVDIGGNAQASPITIQRNNVNESVMGLASIQITVNYGGYTLAPNSATATWNSISP